MPCWIAGGEMVVHVPNLAALDYRLGEKRRAMTTSDGSSSLTIDAYKSEKKMLVALKGRLVLENCDGARNQLQVALKPGIDYLHVDIGEMEYVDSVGLGILVGLKMSSNRNRIHLSFLFPTDRVIDIFWISKLDTIFEISPDAESRPIRDALKKEEFLIWSKEIEDSR